ncbi:hypothetical protein NGM10_16125 (plasmid) [Halorussus salilacus]|uniref:DUF7344 domain-containing protein n=1 Tax=Halorussus salilacus TaxID=2953750 RepID=UPI00209D4136|nr:hypothetical protein [Halorussus salilacus]USZ69929.1 hypothetical protein NGM10_16125 [Halorussus salilacus]
MAGDSAAGGDDEDDRGGSAIGVDEVLALLSERYRRHAIACLDGQPMPVPIERLTDEVAGREFQQPPDNVSMIKRTQIATALHHNHLPKLEEAGIIAYDTDEGKVTEVTIREPLEGFLDKVRRHEG